MKALLFALQESRKEAQRLIDAGDDSIIDIFDQIDMTIGEVEESLASQEILDNLK